MVLPRIIWWHIGRFTVWLWAMSLMSLILKPLPCQPTAWHRQPSSQQDLTMIGPRLEIRLQLTTPPKKKCFSFKRYPGFFHQITISTQQVTQLPGGPSSQRVPMCPCLVGQVEFHYQLWRLAEMIQGDTGDHAWWPPQHGQWIKLDKKGCIYTYNLSKEV